MRNAICLAVGFCGAMAWPGQVRGGDPEVIEASEIRVVRDGETLFEVAPTKEGVALKMGVGGHSFVAVVDANEVRFESRCGTTVAKTVVSKDAFTRDVRVAAGKGLLIEQVHREVEGRDSWAAQSSLQVGKASLRTNVSTGLANIAAAYAEESFEVTATRDGLGINAVGSNFHPIVTVGKGGDILSVGGTVQKGLEVELRHVRNVHQWKSDKK